MTKSVEICFDVVSPAAYIGWSVLPRIAKAAGAEIRYTPIFLGGVMQATGNRPPGTVENKGKWMSKDLPRWAAMYDLPYKKNSVHPQMTLTAMRGVVAYLGAPVFAPYCEALFRAMFVEDREIQDAAVLAQIVADVGIDAEEFTARVSDQAVKDKLKANTEGAVERGVFGAPTFFVGEVMHFGQDRMFMVAEDLGTSIHEAMKP